jgi:hypothetical protein
VLSGPNRLPLPFHPTIVCITLLHLCM